VVDSDYEHGVSVLVDADQDPVVTASSAAVAGQLVRQWLAHPGAAGLTGDLDPVRLTFTHRGGSPNSVRRSSPLIVWPAAYSRSAAATASRVPGLDSQASVSCRDSRSSADISTAAARVCRVIVMI
jgi:hypothetical protein